MTLRLPDARQLRVLAVQGRERSTSWQRHHLIPRGVVRRYPDIGCFLDQLAANGAPPLEAGANIVLLPARATLAAQLGMALHRGPHPRYNDLVAAKLDRLRREAQAPQQALRRVTRLQRALDRALRGGGNVYQMNADDPMRLFADYDALDRAITTLFASAVDARHSS